MYLVYIGGIFPNGNEMSSLFIRSKEPYYLDYHGNFNQYYQLCFHLMAIYTYLGLSNKCLGIR